MNTPMMMGDAKFDLSGDFNDALSIIAAAADSDFADAPPATSSAHHQPASPRISSQCLVEEEQQRRRAAQQRAAHQQMLLAYQQQQQLQQQQQQRIIANFQRHHQRSNEPAPAQNQTVHTRLSNQFQINQQQQQQSLSDASYRQTTQLQNQHAASIQPPRLQNQPAQRPCLGGHQPSQEPRVHDQQQAIPPPLPPRPHLPQSKPPLQQFPNHQSPRGLGNPQDRPTARLENQQQALTRPRLQNQQVLQVPQGQNQQAASCLQSQRAATISNSNNNNQPPRVQHQQLQAPAQASMQQPRHQQAPPTSQIHQNQQAACLIANQQRVTMQNHQPPRLHQAQQQPPQSAAMNLAQRQHRVLDAYQQMYNSSNSPAQLQDHQNFQSAYDNPMAPRRTNPPPPQDTQSKQPVKPHVEIVEQPAARGSRFRYGCEVRANGSIPGVSSTPDRKTYPTIRVVGYNGDAVVVVSCVTRDEPYLAHPHNLVGKVWCKGGICKATMAKDNMTVTLDKLGIQCIKKKDVAASLTQRERNKVDPFKNGFEHKVDAASIDLNCVRLAFQVYLEGPAKGQFKIPLPPVVSDPIFDKKSSPDLQIYKLSHCSAPASGGQEMIILCDRVLKEDIKVRFYEERDEDTVWEELADLNQTGAIHKHVAILIQCPKYRLSDFNGVANVYVELVRPSDGMCSNAVPFDYTPVNDPIGMQKKRKRVHESLVMKNLETVSYADPWNVMNQQNFNIIEAR